MTGPSDTDQNSQPLGALATADYRVSLGQNGAIKQGLSGLRIWHSDMETACSHSSAFRKIILPNFADG